MTLKTPHLVTTPRFAEGTTLQSILADWIGVRLASPEAGQTGTGKVRSRRVLKVTNPEWAAFLALMEEKIADHDDPEHALATALLGVDAPAPPKET